MLARPRIPYDGQSCPSVEPTPTMGRIAHLTTLSTEGRCERGFSHQRDSRVCVPETHMALRIGHEA